MDKQQSNPVRKKYVRSSGKNINRLEHAEHYIYLAAGYILVFAAAGLLVAALFEMAGSIMEGKYTTAMVHLLDRVLLALIIFLLALSMRLLGDCSKSNE